MDIYEYLKMDHQKVAELFKLFEHTDDQAYKIEIVEMITQELTLHAVSEEATFYTQLAKAMQVKDDVAHAKKEHDEIKKQLANINAMLPTNSVWNQQVLELKKIVEHHVKEEEGKIFQDAKKVFSEKEAIMIKEMMHDYKDKLLEAQ